MTKNLKTLFLSASLVLLTTASVRCVVAQQGPTALAAEQDAKVAITRQPEVASEVPPLIWHAAIAAAGNINATKASVEVTPDGSFLYALDFQNEQGRKVSVDVASNGFVMAREDTITLQEIPPQVARTLRGWGAALRPSEIQRSVRPAGVVVYELVGEDTQGNEFYAEIPEDGRGIVILPNEAIPLPSVGYQ